MKSLIICEGGTDQVLIQYFMRQVNHWEHHTGTRNPIRGKFQSSCLLTKNNNQLIIGTAGGCANIRNCFNQAIETNLYSGDPSDAYKNIVIVSDRDEANTVDAFEEQLTNVLNDHAISKPALIENDKWLLSECKNLSDSIVNFQILLLIIPFDTTGALETFLLNAVSNKNPYDKLIIEKGNDFVEAADPDLKYLHKRRYKTKAKFDVYFSIRTPVTQFTERQNILKDINWEEYETIQQSFIKLRDLG